MTTCLLPLKARRVVVTPDHRRGWGHRQGSGWRAAPQDEHCNRWSGRGRSIHRALCFVGSGTWCERWPFLLVTVCFVDTWRWLWLTVLLPSPERSTLRVPPRNKQSSLNRNVKTIGWGVAAVATEFVT